MSELGLRVVTGLIGGGALIAFLMLGGWVGSYIISLVITLGMVNEFGHIALNLPDRKEKRYLLLLLSWLTVTVSFCIPDSQFGLLAFCFVVLSVFFLLTAKKHEGPTFAAHFNEAMASIFGVVYALFIPLFLPLLRSLNNGQHFVLLTLLIVFAGDTGAYFGGKAWGRHKLYPLVSPKKTVEGGATGLVSGVLVAVGYKLLVLHDLPWRAVIILPPIVGAFAQAGDFFESYLKRSFDKKDSGAILPGHGGFLDRFDGVVFGMPIMYAGLKLLL